MSIENASFCIMKSINIDEYSVLVEKYINILASCRMTSIIASFFVSCPCITYVSTDSEYNMLHFSYKVTDIVL
jgi:hypothetical protein